VCVSFIYLTFTKKFSELNLSNNNS